MERILFLVSGEGTNFESLALAIQRQEVPNAVVVGMISNRAKAPALARAARLGVPAHVVESRAFRNKEGRLDRDAYDFALLEKIQAMNPSWICLAGYLLLLSPAIIRAYPGRILNIHPSLLPEFKGLHAQKQALDAGVKTSGCTVHYVTEGLDEGPSIIQIPVPVLPGDSVESLSTRIRAAEHRAYLEGLRRVLANHA